MIFTLLVAASALLASPQQPAAGDAAKAAESAALAEYNAQRSRAPNTADAHWKLGLWCEQKGLKAEATAEFAAVVRLDPGRDPAWKKLGYVKHNGRWASPEALAAERAEADEQKKADALWMPRLARWKSWLGQKAKRADADRELAAVTDPRAVPAIWKAFAGGGPDDQERAIDVLGHVEGRGALHALAILAIYGKTEGVRRAAVETLARRKADDVLMFWIGQLRDPTKYEVRPVAGPGSPGVLLVDGERFNVRRFYAPPSVFQAQQQFLNGTPNLGQSRGTLQVQFESNSVNLPPGSRYVGYDAVKKQSFYIYDYTWAPKTPAPDRPSGDPAPAYQKAEQRELQTESNLAFALGETMKMANGAQMRLESDIAAIEVANATIRETNGRLTAALRRVAGEPKLGESREEWLKWWMEHRGYAYVPPKERAKRTVDVQVPLPYVPTSGPPIIAAGGGGGGSSAGTVCLIWDHEKGQSPRVTPENCFAAGTPVLTPDGPRPIESLRPGDRVLSRGGPATVLDVYRSQASRTLRLVVAGEAIVTTAGHPLWKVGPGWTRAGDLAPGDAVLASAGPARVDSIEPGAGATVYNLLVSDGACYLVGRPGLLAHDGGPAEAPSEVPSPR
jgi:hypothetical protein